MNPLTREWVEKAEADLATAARELRVRKSPNYDAVCFHAQQGAEKYLKAVLHARAIPFARTHNLAGLLDLALGLEPSWEMMRTDLQGLTAMAVGFRHPGGPRTRLSPAMPWLLHGLSVPKGVCIWGSSHDDAWRRAAGLRRICHALACALWLTAVLFFNPQSTIRNPQ